MRTFAELWGKVNGGRYYVKRGAISWLNFPFSQKQYAVALLVDQSSILRMNGKNEAHVTMEVFTTIPPQDYAQTAPQINDDVLDEIVNDIETVIVQAQQARDPNNADFPVVFKLITEDAWVIETHDTDLKVQGAIVQFKIGY
jgi:hypothetical protein